MVDEKFDMVDQAGGFKTDKEVGVNGLQKNLMPLFLLIDTSGSMSGPKIEQVKTAVEEIKMQLSLQNTGNDDADVKVSVLCFDDAPRWEAKIEDPALVNTDFQLGIMTNMGAAFIELEKMLSRSKLIQKGQCAGYKRAVMILLTDGVPTDDVDRGIAALKTNNWFVKGTRIAFAIGSDADTSCLEKFTGNPETVLQVKNINVLSSILAKIAVVTSTTATHAAGINPDDATTQAQKNEDFRNSASESADSVVNAIDEQVVEGKIDENDAAAIFSGWEEP